MIYKEELRDLFTVPDDYYLAQCISSDFAMGAGIAVEFNRRFDEKNHLRQRFPNYQSCFRNMGLQADCILDGRVLNLVTKERYFHKPTLKSMYGSLRVMKDICTDSNITKIAMPTIGAGLDRLSWNDVSELIKKVFNDTNVEILVCRR